MSPKKTWETFSRCSHTKACCTRNSMSLMRYLGIQIKESWRNSNSQTYFLKIYQIWTAKFRRANTNSTLSWPPCCRSWTPCKTFIHLFLLTHVLQRSPSTFASSRCSSGWLVLSLLDLNATHAYWPCSQVCFLKGISNTLSASGMLACSQSAVWFSGSGSPLLIISKKLIGWSSDSPMGSSRHPLGSDVTSHGFSR